MRRLMVCVLCAVVYAPVSAQVAEQSKCWIGSLSFSPGAIAHTGGRTSVCSTDFTWEPTEGRASGCIAADEFYSVGAIENGPRSDSIKMECKDSGTWERLSE